MVQDPAPREIKDANGQAIDIRNVERTRPGWEDYYLDGPVTPRVAVLDFDEHGALQPGAAFKGPATARGYAGYAIPVKTQRPGNQTPDYDVHSPEFIQVSVFTTVRKVMEMFETEDALGRPLVWAFGAPQLLVVPRAGRMTNAYYQRESHSLQFFYFDHDGKRIYTALSRDIVAHETAHAIIDGIAPDLYSALSPQSLAIHEGVADIVAALMAFESHYLVPAVLSANGTIKDANAFSAVAEEFGQNKEPGGPPYLRSLLNSRTMDPLETQLDADGRPRLVDRRKPHSLSQVLSGSLYSLVVDVHQRATKAIALKKGIPEFSASGEALAAAGGRLKRLVIRGLDYLPPGEASFIDYGRAIVASDQASYPDDPDERTFLAQQFVDRHMAGKGDLDPLDVDSDALADVDLQTLVDSDFAAYEFANRHREFLNIPAEIHFKVLPRLDVTKMYYREGGVEERIRECIFKVSWDLMEANQSQPGLPPGRRLIVGTTLAVDWLSKKVRALITSDATGARPTSATNGLALQKQDRDQALALMAEEGILHVSESALGPEDMPLFSAVIGEIQGDTLRVRGSGRALHIAAGI
jgi:hypothetical protein